MHNDIVLGTCPLNHCPRCKYCLLLKLFVPVLAFPVSMVGQEEIGTFALSKAYHLKLLVYTLCWDKSEFGGWGCGGEGTFRLDFQNKVMNLRDTFKNPYFIRIDFTTISCFHITHITKNCSETLCALFRATGLIWIFMGINVRYLSRSFLWGYIYALMLTMYETSAGYLATLKDACFSIWNPCGYCLSV